MDLKISVKKVDGYLLIIVSGVIKDLKDQISMDEQLAKEIIKYGIKNVIAEESELKYFPNVASILNTTKLVDFYMEELPYKIKSFNIASVVNQDIKDDADFYETYCQNRGFNLRVFYTFEDALKYIKSK